MGALLSGLAERVTLSEDSVPLLLRRQENIDVSSLTREDFYRDYSFDAEVGGFRIKPTYSEVNGITMTLPGSGGNTTTTTHTGPDSDLDTRNDIDHLVIPSF
jgi:hypothetical protein